MDSPQQTSVGETALLELGGQRKVSFIHNKFPFTFTFDRITRADWIHYFDGIDHRERNDGKARELTLDMDTPGQDLVVKKMIDVEGYRGDFKAKSGWQDILPPNHLNNAAWLLRDVMPSEEETDGAPDPTCIEVRLNARWGVSKPGEMNFFKGTLVHRFRPATAEHRRNVYRTGAMSKVVGGRNGITIHALRHKVLLELYDELITGVEGYSWNSQPFTTIEDTRREMDAYHAVIAIQHLFAPVTVESEAA